MIITVVTVNNPMCGNVYKFACSKNEFMDRFDNQIAGCGYFTDETIEGLTLVLNPSNCSFIEIYEETKERDNLGYTLVQNIPPKSK